MSVRVTDPSGVVWDVSREWLSRPRWKREAEYYPPPDFDFPDLDLGDDVAGMVAIVLAVAVAVLFFLVFLFFWPLLLLLAGLAVAAVVLVGRLTGVAAWTVRAASGERTLEWRVRGFLRSRRAMLGVARALERQGAGALEGAPAPE